MTQIFFFGETAVSILRFLDEEQVVIHTRENSSGRVIRSSQRPVPTQHKRRTPMSSSVFEPAIPTIERQQTYASDSKSTEIVTQTHKGNGKAIPLQTWTGPEGSRRLRLPDFKTIGT